MDFQSLQTFVLVAEMNSFTKAAERQNYSQSTISFQIKQLEKEIGIPLFDRVNHGIRLTEKGEEILEIAQQLLSLKDSIHKTADGEKLNGHIRIAMANSLSHWLFWNYFKNFHEEYPDITISISTAITEEMFAALNRNEVDLVCTLDKHFFSSNYILGTEQKVNCHFIAPKKHPLAYKKEVTIKEIAEYPFILTEKNNSYRDMMDDVMAEHSIEIKPVLEIGDAWLISHLVAQNMGLSMIPDYASQEMVDAGDIVRLNVPEFEPDIWLQVLYHKGKWCSPEMKAVIKSIELASKNI